MSRLFRIWALILAALTMASAQPLTGRWDGTVTIDGMKVPFSLQFDGAGEKVRGAFFKGEDRVASTGGSFNGSALRLQFAQFGKVLDAKLVEGMLKGTYGTYPLEASAYCTCSYEGEAGPDIAGAWQISEGSEKLRLTVLRKGEDTFATLVQPSGSSGPHTGRFDGLQFTLNHFDGGQASVLEIVPLKDGGLDVTWKQPAAAVKKYNAVK
jgi:hypothetical protein